jgi:hypothetical protein
VDRLCLLFFDQVYISVESDITNFSLATKKLELQGLLKDKKVITIAKSSAKL